MASGDSLRDDEFLSFEGGTNKKGNSRYIVSYLIKEADKMGEMPCMEFQCWYP